MLMQSLHVQSPYGMCSRRTEPPPRDPAPRWACPATIGASFRSLYLYIVGKTAFCSRMAVTALRGMVVCPASSRQPPRAAGSLTGPTRLTHLPLPARGALPLYRPAAAWQCA